MGAWLWNKLGRLSAEELQHNQAWVSLFVFCRNHLTHSSSLQVEEVFQNSMNQVKTLAALRKDIVLSLLQNEIAGNARIQRAVSILTRHLRAFGKFFRRLQQLSPERFALLPMSSDLILFYWSQILDSTNYPQNFIVG